jgi:hypothetical protein
MLKSYFNGISEDARRGDAREESYYSTLEGLINNFAKSINKKHIHVTTLPKKTEAGNPDFRIWDGKQSIVGYIEAKRPGEDLDIIERTEQLKRYLNTFPNLILTNFFEFRLYRKGVLIDKVLFAKPLALTSGELKAFYSAGKERDFITLFEKFFAFSLPKAYTAKSLAIELAKRTRFLREQVIVEELKEEESNGTGFIIGFYEAFQKYLIFGLTKEDFANLYAQTITYGLFAARTRSQNGFNRKLAFDNIPRTIGILREIFQFISLGDLPQQMEWIVDDISDVLATADVNQILHEFYHEGKGSDPIIHFYETFLAEYDPKERERRGVYYTPEPVVSYIVRSLHIILKEEFGKEDGFADDSVTVLDPAAGTLTFMAEASKMAVEEFVSKYGEGGKENLIKDHILENFYAFELMMAPYAVGHLKMSFLLEELGYKLQEDYRFKLYLTNTLEMEDLEQTPLPGMRSLSEESHLAGKVKKKTPILVILGNPPYSGISPNKGNWITEKIEDYKYVDGQHFGERKHWLQDDYVKFIRFAQWKIDQKGEGVLGFITNHGYLDNPTFRGMRQSLMKSFNEIYLLDLHGNSLKKKRCPDGSKDENVFDIQQGVAIALFIKKKDKNESEVLHADLWGHREEKYKWLEKYDVTTCEYRRILPQSPYYFFIPRDTEGIKDYLNWIKINEIFLRSTVGFVTGRDKLTIAYNDVELWNRINNFISIDHELAREAYSLGKDSRDWKVKNAQEDIKNTGPARDLIKEVLYRPFDIRFTYYTGTSRGFYSSPQKAIMHHMIEENLGMITARSNKSNLMDHFFVTDKIMETKCGERTTQSALFPLYLYPDQNQKKSINSSTTKTPNLNQNLIKSLTDVYSTEPTPEEIFYYIYAVLYSNTYRTKYAEFLKIDFPRVPFTRDYNRFKKMGEMGKKLVDLHLMKSDELNNPIAKFQGSGENQVEKRKYDEGEERVYINKTQYFEGIEKEVWKYQIGGYQVLDKWLKDRKGRELSLEDIKHYCRVVTAIRKTIDVQKVIGQIYPGIEEKVIAFSIQKARTESLMDIS